MKVFVISKRGKPLMPCSERKARILLKEHKATIYKYNPFTIQLNYATGETVQDCHIGVDTGAKHIGIAVTSEDKVLFKGEVELRQNVSSLLSARKGLRNNRRYRKTRYRQERILNRHRHDGWLPPSVQSRINNTFYWIDTFIKLVPNSQLHIEVGKFDVQKMKNPDITHEEYQQGDIYGFYNDRYYVFARDNYTCQVCKRKNKILRTHHIVYRCNGGTDAVSNLITVCTDCHTAKNHAEGGILYKWQEEHKKVKQYKEPTFMNILRRRIFDRYPDAYFTYGNITTPHRKELGLEKTHYNDAITITGIKCIKSNTDDWLCIKQLRKKKRSLHEATPRKGKKNPNVNAKRNNKNIPKISNTSGIYYLLDKVNYCGQIGYVTGFAAQYGVVIKNIITGEYLHKVQNKNSLIISTTQIKVLCHNNNWGYVREKSA